MIYLVVDMIKMNNQIQIKDLDSVVSNIKTSDKSELEVLKELFKPEEIETKTELTQNQIILFNQKRMIAKILKWDRLNDALSDFMLLQVSLNRKGRNEFIQGFQSHRENTIIPDRKWYNPATWGNR